MVKISEQVIPNVKERRITLSICEFNRKTLHRTPPPCEAHNSVRPLATRTQPSIFYEKQRYPGRNTIKREVRHGSIISTFRSTLYIVSLLRFHHSHYYFFSGLIYPLLCIADRHRDVRKDWLRIALILCTRPQCTVYLQKPSTWCSRRRREKKGGTFNNI